VQHGTCLKEVARPEVITRNGHQAGLPGKDPVARAHAKVIIWQLTPVTHLIEDKHVESTGGRIRILDGCCCAISQEGICLEVDSGRGEGGGMSWCYCCRINCSSCEGNACSVSSIVFHKRSVRQTRISQEVMIASCLCHIQCQIVTNQIYELVDCILTGGEARHPGQGRIKSEEIGSYINSQRQRYQAQVAIGTH
jgi:hypothetical protein